METNKVYKQVIKVLDADFNGKEFDGDPLVPLGVTRKVFGSLLSSDRITVNWTGDTDYARWNVVTPEGVVIAEPGDIIIVNDDDTLTVIKSTPIEPVNFGLIDSSLDKIDAGKVQARITPFVHRPLDKK